MTSVGISAPDGLARACAAWARSRGADVAGRGRPATEYWVFALGGVLPHFPRHVPLKFFALTETVPLEVFPLPHLSPNEVPSARDLLPPHQHAHDTRAGLAEIERRLRAGQSYADMEAEVDALLGTGMEPRDSDAESEYELQAAERRGEVIDP